MGKVTDRINKIVEPLVAEEDLELVETEFAKEGNNWVLRVFIEDLEGDVTLDQCELISRRLSEILDVQDPIEQSYILEVSSPGIERPLKKLEDYDRFVDNLVLIKTYAPVEGAKEFLGILKHRKGTEIKIEKKGEGEVVAIPFSSISSARLAIDLG